MVITSAAKSCANADGGMVGRVGTARSRLIDQLRQNFLAACYREQSCETEESDGGVGDYTKQYFNKLRRTSSEDPTPQTLCTNTRIALRRIQYIGGISCTLCEGKCVDVLDHEGT